jgi:hypothetical protein
MATKKNVRKVQMILADQEQSWPFVGNALDNANGSITIFLDRGCTLVLPSGEAFSAEVDKPIKLIVKKAWAEQPARPA